MPARGGGARVESSCVRGAVGAGVRATSGPVSAARVARAGVRNGEEVSAAPGLDSLGSALRSNE